MSTAQCAFINIVLFPLESHSHLKSRRSDCWPSRKAELDPDIICFSEFKTQVTLQAKVAQIRLFCPNVTHIWFSYDSLNSTNPFFFQIRPRPLPYVVLNRIYFRCFAMQFQSERPCHISCDFYFIAMQQTSQFCAGGGGKIKITMADNK